MWNYLGIKDEMQINVTALYSFDDEKRSYTDMSEQQETNVTGDH